MSFHRLKFFLAIPACLVAMLATVQGEEWMRGASVVTSVAGEVLLQEVGGESLQLHSIGPLPRTVSGLLKVRTQPNDAVFLKTSNRISIYNEGAGFFAIERFEQDIATSQDQGKSRMILNFRQGFLAVDNRELSEDSQMIVETPLGRISVKNGWWSMRIAHDDRSHIYDFSIECADGVLRFTALDGDAYTLRNGQCLRGAGASSRPSINVAGISEDGSEFFEEFTEMEAAAAALELPAETFLTKMKPIKRTENVDAAPAAVSSARTTKRPLVIEYAPQSAPVTPFRAVIRPPSSCQADLF